MLRRRDFWTMTVANGWVWLRGILDSVGRFLLLLAVLLGVSVGSVVAFGWWALVDVTLVLVLLTLAEGAYRTWDVAARRVEELTPNASPQEPPPMVAHAAEVVRIMRKALAESSGDDFNSLRSVVRPINNRMMGSGNMEDDVQLAMSSKHGWTRVTAERVANALDKFSRA